MTSKTVGEIAGELRALLEKATPSPWTVEEYGDRDYPSLVLHSDTESRVCFMATPGSHGDPARIEADAHLITAMRNALPALLSALESQTVSAEEVERCHKEAFRVFAVGDSSPAYWQEFAAALNRTTKEE